MKVRLIKLTSGETIISEIHLWGGNNDDMELLNPYLIPIVGLEDPSDFRLIPMTTIIDTKRPIHIKHQTIAYTATPKEEYIQKYIQTVRGGR